MAFCSLRESFVCRSGTSDDAFFMKYNHEILLFRLPQMQWHHIEADQARLRLPVIPGFRFHRRRHFQFFSAIPCLRIVTPSFFARPSAFRSSISSASRAIFNMFRLARPGESFK